MVSERLQRQIDRFLGEAEEAMADSNWARVRDRAENALALDPSSGDATAYLAAADRRLAADAVTSGPPPVPEGAPTSSSPEHPQSFAAGRYEVVRFLGEGGKKRVYLVHDSQLDREVAFALLKSDGLDPEGLARIRREAQAMGRLGDHPHIVTVHDIGDENGQPYIVSQYMAGGDLGALIQSQEQHRPPIDLALKIADQVCQALEHAHTNGVIHRDLKPGNIWLAKDGTAKLGDFGLAVALDRSRLTQAGMMVGTVSYMSPEQAIGADVTARSDLYSLGALLYELVTGRPPFVGDESVAIITQHLNTPPVAPSWHVPDCPPRLETLILRLLEKDPVKRPASAADVRQMLASVKAGAQQALPLRDAAVEARPAVPAGPLYRQVFVGREAELRELQRAFDATLSGQGSLIAVVGEPGIGKTALCEQLATYVAVRGGHTLFGHSYEEGSLSLPYLPFIEAMRAYVLAREPDGLRHDLGTGAQDVARIVSEIRERVGVEPSTSGPDPEEERWRLYQAVTSFLRNASAVQPLVIAIEDLHWADRGTLDLLIHLARNLAGARLLLVGTYRDVEVDRAHPLSGALAELRRTSAFSRVTLRGLRAPEVQRMLTAIAGQEVPLRLAEAVFRQTEGNPLFVQEVARYLVEEGLLTAGPGGAGRVADLTAIAMSLPEGLREVIGKRLSRLSAEGNRVLAMGAVIGREFALDTLRLLAPFPEEELVQALEEATRVGVLEEESHIGQVRYRFSHAFFRQTLYEELSAPRRIQLHQQVARALEEQYVARLEEHATELAEHFSHSSDRSDLAKAVAYGESAAQRAVAVNAYGEAVRRLERALEVQEVLDPDDTTKRCDLLLALGAALAPAGEPQRAYEVVMPEAFGLAEGLGQRALAFRACWLAIEAMLRYGWPTIVQNPEYRTWVERADRLALPQGIERVLADTGIADLHDAAGESGRARALRWRALEGARAVGDPDALWRAADHVLNLGWFLPDQFNELVRLAREFIDQPPEGANALIQGLVLHGAGSFLLMDGDRVAWERIQARIQAIAARSRDSLLLMVPFWGAQTLAILDGDLEGSVAIGERLAAKGEELGSPVWGLWETAHSNWEALSYLGQSDRFVLGFDRFAELTTGGLPDSWWFLRRDLEAFYVRRDPAARVALSVRIQEMRNKAPEDLTTVRMAWLLEAAVAVGDLEAAASLVPRLRSLATIVLEKSAVGRHLGAAAALLGDHEAARAFYETAIEATARIRHRPEQALTRLQLAELLLGGTPDERREAQAHLDFAIPEFENMKMAPSLERALDLRAQIQA